MFVRAGVNEALPTSTVLNINGGNGSGSRRVSAYDLNGFNQTLSGLTNTTGLSLRSQRVINTNTTTLFRLTVNNASDHSFSGTIGGNTKLGVGANNLAFTKNGAGTFTLGNSNPYTGATLISGGTLSLATNGAITGSVGITINGSTAKLLQTSSTAIAPTVTRTFDGAATVNTFSNSATAPIVTTNLATNAAGTVTINPTSASWAPGTYDLISYGGGSNPHFPALRSDPMALSGPPAESKLLAAMRPSSANDFSQSLLQQPSKRRNSAGLNRERSALRWISTPGITRTRVHASAAPGDATSVPSESVSDLSSLT